MFSGPSTRTTAVGYRVWDYSGAHRAEKRWRRPPTPASRRAQETYWWCSHSIICEQLSEKSGFSTKQLRPLFFFSGNNSKYWQESTAPWQIDLSGTIDATSKNLDWQPVKGVTGVTAPKSWKDSSAPLLEKTDGPTAETAINN